VEAMKAIDRGGPVLIRAKIVLIFKGSGWLTGKPAIDDTKAVLQAVIASPYTSHMKQYRDIRRPQITDALVDTQDVGGLGPDPRGFIKDKDVWVVSDADMQGVVRSAMQRRPPQDGEQTYYMVIFSNFVIPVLSDKNLLNAEGYHGHFDDRSRMIVYGVVLNNASRTLDDIWASPGSLPAVFAHEVVEACTDPGPTTAFILDDNEELADLSDTRVVRLSSVQQDITLAAYWSQLLGSAVVPTSYSLRVFLGLSSATPGFLSAALPRGHGARSAVLSAFNQ
jgi:hypothetical protein